MEHTITLRTNLDEPRIPSDLISAYQELGIVPPIGAYIVIPYCGKFIDLEVVSIRQELKKGLSSRVSFNFMHTTVELHIPRCLGMSIRDWEDRLRRIRGV